MKRKYWFVSLVIGMLGVVMVSEKINQRYLVKNENIQDVSFGTMAKANDQSGINRQDPKWLENYCLERVVEVGNLPISFERQRGPMMVLEPVYKRDRFEGAKKVETCDFDYYIWPKAREAFADMGIKHVYSNKVWEEFHLAVVASVSANLKHSGWRELVGESNEKTTTVVPNLMLQKDDRNLGLREYLDVFLTKDEEIVFEMMVVDMGKLDK